MEYTKDPRPLEDEEFYSTLAYYSPLFNAQTGTPIFLSNRETSSTLIFMLIINALAILECISLWSAMQDSLSSTTIIRLLFFVNLITLLVTNISYLLTIKLNPGIRNLSKIRDEEYEKSGKEYCIYC